jgi:murein DD-endopeptidase MepM/ murein hydrolase activator NlpD
MNEVEPESDSFDPRQWSNTRDPPVRAAPGSSAPPPNPAKVARIAPVLSYGMSAALLLSGLVIEKLWVSGGKAPGASPVHLQQSHSVASAATPGLTHRILNLQHPADLRDALQANGVAASDAAAATQAALDGLGNSDKELRAAITLTDLGTSNRLDRIEASFFDSSGAVVTRGTDGRFTASRVAATLSTVIKVARGEMDANNFYSSAVAAGVTDSLIPDFAKAFTFDFDFQREINPGDVFEAAFEQSVNAENQPVGPPRLIYASLTTAAKSRALYHFQAKGQDPGWFDGNGRSIVRSLMRTPIEGARVSSGFGWRLHPVLGFMKLHKGTDFAAPIGTPIYAAGAGKVVWAQMKGPNGNLCIVQHDNGWQTFYLHMNRYAPGIVAGVRVTQGQQVGEVGTTGRSTGPHLHYEVHVDGQPVDPQSIKTEEGHTLSGDVLRAFFKERDRIDVARAHYAG